MEYDIAGFCTIETLVFNMIKMHGKKQKPRVFLAASGFTLENKEFNFGNRVFYFWKQVDSTWKFVVLNIGNLVFNIQCLGHQFSKPGDLALEM